MRDWEALVEGHLVGLALEPAERAEVIAELAAHLEESYEALLKEGAPEHVAFHRVLSRVTNWRDLQGRILIAKRSRYPMQKRVHQLWIPGFLTMALSIVFLVTLQKLGFNARIVCWRESDIFFYAPWLVSLPFLGALGAYISLRAGGSRGTALLASIFPALALTLTFLLMFPMDMIIEPIIGRQVDFNIVAAAHLKDGIGWILVPGAALLAGGLLVQLYLADGQRRKTRRLVSEANDA
jgi:hypothetical protein